MVILKEDLCVTVVEVSRFSGRVMAVVLIFEEDVLRLTCGHALALWKKFLKEKKIMS